MLDLGRCMPGVVKCNLFSKKTVSFLMAPLIVIPLIVTLLEYQAIYLPPERRVDSGRVGQWMGGMQRRQWRLEQEHLLCLKEQQLHLPPAFRLKSSFYKDLARAN